MYSFDIQRPTSVGDAVAELGTDEALPLGGGQTLIPTLKQRLSAPSVLVSLSGIAEIKGVCTGDDGALCIGGGTTHATVAKEASVYPGLAALAGNIGDPAVRNRGTIGGSLANNDPSACYPAAALGSGATIVTNTRSIAADDYFQGMFATALNEGEIITEVRFRLYEIRAARVALCAGWGVRREICGWCACGRHGRVGGRCVPLVRSRGGFVG